MRVVAALLLIAGCATPPGEIPKEDLSWSKAVIPLGYQAAYRNLRETFTACARDVAEGDLYTDIAEGRLTVYIRALEGRSDFVVGTINVKQQDAGKSILTTAVQKKYAVADIHRAWERWALGKGGCAY